MLLFSRQSRSRIHKLLIGLFAAVCVFGIDGSPTCAAENVSAKTVTKTTNETERNLRPALPLDATSAKNRRSRPASALSFRRPVIAGQDNHSNRNLRRAAKVPAKAVSNRVPERRQAVPVAQHGWVARDAVNLNQPLRDPEHGPVVDDQPDTNRPGTNQPDTNQPDTNRPGTNRPDTNRPGTNRPGTSDAASVTTDSRIAPAATKPLKSNTLQRPPSYVGDQPSKLPATATRDSKTNERKTAPAKRDTVRAEDQTPVESSSKRKAPTDSGTARASSAQSVAKDR